MRSHAFPVLTALLMVSALAACASNPGSSDGTSAVSSEGAAIPTPTSTPTPTLATHSTRTAALTLSGGYEASAAVTWYEPKQITSAADVSAACAPTVQKELGDQALIGYPFTAVVTYKTVNGFTWPVKSAVHMKAGLEQGNIHIPLDTLAYSCGDLVVGDDSAINNDYYDFPVSDAPVSRSGWIIFGSKKTPDAPNGNLSVDDPSWMQIYVSNLYGEAGASAFFSF